MFWVAKTAARQFHVFSSSRAQKIMFLALPLLLFVVVCLLAFFSMEFWFWWRDLHFNRKRSWINYAKVKNFLNFTPKKEWKNEKTRIKTPGDISVRVFFQDIPDKVRRDEHCDWLFVALCFASVQWKLLPEFSFCTYEEPDENVQSDLSVCNQKWESVEQKMDKDYHDGEKCRSRNL